MKKPIKAKPVKKVPTMNPSNWNIRFRAQGKGFRVQWFTPYGKSWEDDPWFPTTFRKIETGKEAVTGRYGSSRVVFFEPPTD